MSDTLSSERADGTETGHADAAPGQRRLLLIVGGLAGFLVLALAAYFLFLSGGSDDDLGALPPQGPTPTAEDGQKGDTKGNTKGDNEGESLPAEYDGEIGTNPFVPLAVEAVVEPPTAVEPADTPDTDTTTGGTGASTGSTGSTATNPQPAITPAPAPTPTQTNDPVEETSYKVILRAVDTKKDSAIIEVDGKRYVIKADGMFPSAKKGPFKLVRVAEPATGKVTATVRFGSDAPVELLENDKTVFTL